MKATLSLLTQPAFRQALKPGAWGAAPQAQAIVLANRQLALEILPGLAGGIAALDWQGGGVPVPVLRTAAGLDAGVLHGELACRPLVKAGPAAAVLGATGCCGFAVADASEANPWRVTQASRSSVTLALDCAGPHPYRLTQTFTLDQASVTLRLALTNRGRRTQSLGLGLACSVARDATTWLAAAAAGLWCPGSAAGAVRHVPAPPAWRFGLAYPLPAAHLEQAFSEWAGVARVHWPARQLALTLSGDTSGYILTTPAAAECFGFHPLDCGPDAKLRGLQPESGTQRLAPGDSLVRQFVLSVASSDWRAAASAVN